MNKNPFYIGNINPQNALPNNPAPINLDLEKDNSGEYIEIDIKKNNQQNQQEIPPQNIDEPQSKNTIDGYNEVFGPTENIYRKTLYNVNIIYYNEALRNDLKNIDNEICSYFKSNIYGTFYGINNFNLFMYVCQKIKNIPKYFILISSGYYAEKLYNYCAQMNIDNIYSYYIFCKHKEKYLLLKQRYPKLKNIFTSFDELVSATLSDQIIINQQPKKSSNLIFLSDYNQKYVSWHFDLARKFSIYKLLKTNKSFDKSRYFELVKNKVIIIRTLPEI